MFSTLIFLILTIFQNKSIAIHVATSELPAVSIAFQKGFADVDFQNSTLAIISNSSPAFILKCDASYPIEWILNYHEDDDGASEKKHAEIYRDVADFQSPNTYKYSATLNLEYTGKLQVFTNFSCKSVSNPEFQTHVITTAKNHKSVMYLEITSDKRYNTIEDKPKFPTSCNTIASVSGLEDKASCWRCERVSDGKELDLDFMECQTPIECKNIHKRINRGRNCLQIRTDRNKTAERCKTLGCREYKPTGCKDYNPRNVICKDHGSVLAQQYYFGLPRSENKPPKIYFDWTEMDPKDMVFIHPVSEELYSGQNLTVICEMSKYYFSKGSWFGLTSDRKNISYIQTGDKEINDDDWKGSFISSVNITLQENNPKFVYCFAPVWNSTEWINVSIELNFKTGVKPQISSLNLDCDSPVVVGENSRYLECNFSGKPEPTVTWLRPKGTYVFETDTKTKSSKLIFSEVTFTSSGEYKCVVDSFLGNDSKSFTIVATKSDSLKPTLFIGIGGLIFVVILVVVVTFIMVRLWKIIKFQREALRILTDAEIQEFMEGNPESLSRNDILNENVIPDAIPYDKKFEIAPEKLQIDYETLLGSGAFGKVYKGLIHKDNYPHYLKLQKLLDKVPGPKNEGLEVAVKTCDPNVDVLYFKALLSEIKVMTYLGHHNNIVSLVGACTQNIRNREVFIAVEFCATGGLDSYLQKHRFNFLNKVQHGILAREKEMKVEGRKGYVLYNQSEISTEDLFKWTYEIATGMEYLQEKKVIHGDLATRNVFLTEENIAKIGDFGLSRQLMECSNYVKTTESPLPWRYLAPESLRDLEFSLKSDVWSFGVTLWEIFTLSELPYPEVTWSTEFLLSIELGLRLSKPIYATNEIYEFMLKCWQMNPKNRPGYDEIRRLCTWSLKLNKSESSSSLA